MAVLQRLPDHILETQTCTNCFKYLSVLPVNQNKRGEVYCGRCQDQFKNSVEHASMLSLKLGQSSSMFDVVSKQYLFKCINHYEGCKTLVDVSSSKEHEEECPYQPHECFFCSFKGNWCQIINHCLKEHASNVTKNGLFHFNVGCNFSQRLIFVLKNNIFLITIDITEKNFSLIISPEVVDDFVINQFSLKFFMSSDSENGQFMFTDYSLFDTNSINYFKKDTEELITRFGPKTKISCRVLLKQVKLSEKELDLEKKYVDFNLRENDLIKRERLVKTMEQEFLEGQESVQPVLNLMKKLLPTHFTCTKCKKIVADAAFFCSENHCYCQNCLSSKCIACNQPREYCRVIELDQIKVTCDWSNCTESVNLANYLDHKSNCLLRPYRCPLRGCLRTVYSYQELINHWHCRIPPLICDAVVEYNQYGEYTFYWLLDTNIFHVLVKFLGGDVQVIVEETAVLPHKCKFKIEVETKNHNGFQNIIKWQEISGSYFGDKYIVKYPGVPYTKFRISAKNS